MKPHPKHEDCAHKQAKPVLSEGGAELGVHCGLCLRIWGERACARKDCGKTFLIETVHAKRCCSIDCERKVRNAQRRKRRAQIKAQRTTATA